MSSTYRIGHNRSCRKGRQPVRMVPALAVARSTEPDPQSPRQTDVVLPRRKTMRSHTAQHAIPTCRGWGGTSCMAMDGRWRESEATLQGSSSRYLHAASYCLGCRRHSDRGGFDDNNMYTHARPLDFRRSKSGMDPRDTSLQALTTDTVDIVDSTLLGERIADELDER